MRILIVEDEEALATGLKFNFEQEHFAVTLVGDGPSAIEQVAAADPPFNVVILDLMLPGMSGYETCRRIRALDDYLPILVLSARTLSEDKTMAFDCGCDQYMTKPFALPELLSRVRNLVERHPLSKRPSPAADDRHPGDFSFGAVHVDFNKYEVNVGDRTHNPTSLEMQLLRYFIENEGSVCSRQEILEAVWGADSDVTTRTIDNFVMRLRRLIEENPANPRHILSVRGTGYRFVARPDDAKPDAEAS